jgi:hypothetical protein
MEVADIFRDHGPAWRRANAGHVSLGQLKVMSAGRGSTAMARPDTFGATPILFSVKR